MPNRTPGTSAKAKRCTATEGAQQCLKEQHPKTLNHTWGKRGETAQWNEDGTPKVQPDRPTDQLPAVAPLNPNAPNDGHYGMVAEGDYREAPQPDAPVGGYFNGDNTPEPDVRRGPPTPAEVEEARDIAAWHPHIIKPNGEARPMPGGSIGHIAAGTALEAMYGTPEDVADEKTYGGEAAKLLFEIAEQDWANRRVADAAKLVHLHGLIHHMLGARGLLPTPAEVEAAGDGS